MTDARNFDEESSVRVELRVLDPDADPLASARFVRAVETRIATTASAPSVPIDPLYGLWSLPRPLLLAASIIAIAALGLSVGRPQRSTAPATIAESMGVPPQLLATGPRR
jgi:hypothetical protein